MASPLQPNVNVDVYRTANPASPYPSGLPAIAGLRGFLQPRAQAGRHGTALYLKWTHILYTDPGLDIRDAYNSQLDPARNNALADTVILKSTDATSKTAFYVVLVERANRGLASEHFRVYLDRFTPNLWPTDAL